jgi:hypothetical protein
MPDTELAQFIAQCLKSTSYHEAGHTTAAVLQRMPLRERGIHVDMEGSGVSYYCHRLPGDPGRTRKDQLEREQTIIALYSGIAAQKKFFPQCPDEESWTSDMVTIRSLLEEMHPTDVAARSAAQTDLQASAEKLVADNWPLIDELASTLLKKQNTPLPANEVQEGWSRGTKGIEKFMPGSEIKEFYEKFGIVVSILPN